MKALLFCLAVVAFIPANAQLYYAVGVYNNGVAEKHSTNINCIFGEDDIHVYMFDGNTHTMLLSLYDIRQQSIILSSFSLEGLDFGNMVFYRARDYKHAKDVFFFIADCVDEPTIKYILTEFNNGYLGLILQEW